MKYLLEFKHMDSFVSSAVFDSDLPALLSSDANPCCVTRCAFLDLLLSALERNPLERLPSPILEDILLPVVATCSDVHVTNGPWSSCHRQRVATFCARALDRSAQTLLQQLVTSPSVDVRLGSLEGLLRRKDAHGLVRFEMLMSETNIDCQELILDFLAKSSPAEAFDGKSLLSLIDMIPEFRRSSMKCNALTICSLLQTQFCSLEVRLANAINDCLKRILLIFSTRILRGSCFT
jgi:hypothetical protein